MPFVGALPQPIHAPLPTQPIRCFPEGQKIARRKDFAPPEKTFAILLSLNGVNQAIDLQVGLNAFLNCIASNDELVHDGLRIRHVHDFKVRMERNPSMCWWQCAKGPFWQDHKDHSGTRCWS